MFSVVLFFFIGPLFCYLLSEVLTKIGPFVWKESAFISLGEFCVIVAFLPSFGVRLKSFRSGDYLNDATVFYLNIVLAGIIFLLVASLFVLRYRRNENDH
jgi:hypothetical protein